MSEDPTDDGWPEGEDDYSLRVLEEGDPHYKSIGMVAYAWTCLELLLEAFITEAARGDEKALQCIVGQLIGPGPRIRAMIALARYRGCTDPLVAALNKFGRECTELGAKRNRVVHDLVVVSTTTGRAYHYYATADKKLDIGHRVVTDKDLEAVAIEIDDFREKGRDLFACMIDEIGTKEQKELLQRHGMLPVR
jgi:hypothetical protein